MRNRLRKKGPKPGGGHPTIRKISQNRHGLI
jgi:hypothetical protein